MSKYLEEFRSRAAAAVFSNNIKDIVKDSFLTIMEICGGHTLTTMKYGLHSLLPKTLVLKSGPGCPVCVTAVEYIDTAIALLHQHNVIISSFGDMLRVPGSISSLLKERSKKKDIRICFSPLDALQIAKENPDREVVFLAIGFETTAPGIAVAIKDAAEKKIQNISFLTAVKTMPHAMDALCSDKDTKIDGFILPGHVTAIMGTDMYQPVIQKYQIPCVVSGFEPTDMLHSIFMLAEMIRNKKTDIKIQYTRTVKPGGNVTAQRVLLEVFDTIDSSWRGLGTIAESGLGIKEKYRSFDAGKKFQVTIPVQAEHAGCICGDVMKGKKVPTECALFRKICTPENPIGACMVSAEGCCGIYYTYGKIEGR